MTIIDNELILANEVPINVFEKNDELNIGYNNKDNIWELIIRYYGDLEVIKRDFEQSEKFLEITTLLGSYAIVLINANDISLLSNYKQIEYIEKPKRMYFSINNGKTVSCFNPIQTLNFEELINMNYIINPSLINNLYGSGVLIGIIDSGIDYAHPDFRYADGSTRIIELWDQTIAGNPPSGYYVGSIYSSENINLALSKTNISERYNIVPSVDSDLGHGTHVAGICCGNGRASNGLYMGAAPLSSILVVKLGSSANESFPRTTRLMEALNYLITKASEYQMPISINISIGNNYGAHNGRSLIEDFINEISGLWECCICTGSGNEATSGRHAGGTLTNNAAQTAEMVVSGSEPYINMQIWKNYYDDFDISIVAPSGKSININKNINEASSYTLDNNDIYIYYGAPTPGNIVQEIYIIISPKTAYVNNGIWKIIFQPVRILDGRYDLWLPVSESLTPETRFLRADSLSSLTIPSTASRIITVGAYDSLTRRYADFSGQGFTRNNQIKPDIVAPGVNITSTAPNGSYSIKTGTSMAAPFVTGAAALLMEWGIVRGNDPYLYGEKVKAYLINGARQLTSSTTLPSPQTGWGALCVRDSLPI